MIQKGQVSAVLDGGKFVTVTPYTGGTVTFPLVVPSFLVGDLPVHTPVVYTAFADNTGIILCRMDGKYNYKQIVDEVLDALPAAEGEEYGTLEDAEGVSY